jgi:2,3-bisphosphoglycerate-dependent phosphoglycerate mutase
MQLGGFKITMQLYYIRHGQSGNNLLWEQTGSNAGRSVDPELSPLGQQQAVLLADFIKSRGQGVEKREIDFQNVAGFNLTHIYTSLMIRAVATAQPIARALGLPLVAWKDLHETGGIYQENKETGEFTGMPGKNRAYFEGWYPDLVLPADLGPAGWWNRSHETPEERFPRAKRVLAELLKLHGGTEDRVALVSHGGFYQYFMEAIMGLPEVKYHWFGLSNTAISRIDFNSPEITIVYLNQVDFLPHSLIT